MILLMKKLRLGLVSYHRRLLWDGSTLGETTCIHLYAMGLISAAAILAIDNRFRTPSMELTCLETSFGAQKQQFSIPRDSTWPHCN